MIDFVGDSVGDAVRDAVGDAIIKIFLVSTLAEGSSNTWVLDRPSGIGKNLNSGNLNCSQFFKKSSSYFEPSE